MSAAPPRIREMTVADVPAVARVEAESYAFPWSESIFRDCLRAGYVCCVAEWQRQCVGYGIMSVGAGEAHVLNLCVAADHRQLGLGSALLARLTELAIGFGVRDIFLEVRPSNEVALGLYVSRGFAQIGVRKGYYQASGGREDAVVLRKRVLREEC